MESFEAKLARATASNNQEALLGAIGLVVDSRGMAKNPSSGAKQRNLGDSCKLSDTRQVTCYFIMHQVASR